VDLETCLAKRRDTRHFTPDPVPAAVLQKALQAAHQAPSVGLSEPWRFIQVSSPAVKRQILANFQECRDDAEEQLSAEKDRQNLHRSLKLEAITTAPVGLAVFCEQPRDDQYILGTTTARETLQWSVACAIQNLWLSLTAQGYGLGWVSILDLSWLARTLAAPDHWYPMGYLCIGKPATDYAGQPMLEREKWGRRSQQPYVLVR
jgi:nicotinate-nucleotide--dimethylbenzimidazole phosphoribosyltransferase